MDPEEDDRYFQQWFNQVMAEIEMEEYYEHIEFCSICGTWWEDGHSEDCEYA